MPRSDAATTVSDYCEEVTMLVFHRTHAATFCVALLVLAGCTAPNDSASAPSSFASAASSARPGPSGSRSVGPGEFAAAVAEPARVTINVHVPFEGDIAGTDLSIPFDRIEQHVATLPAERTTPLAIYCRSGRMSTTAAATLATLGYVNVVELQGGMHAWEASGRPIEGR